MYGITGISIRMLRNSFQDFEAKIIGFVPSWMREL